MVQLLGVDFGTTNIKAAVFAEDGTTLSSASNRTPTRVQGHLRAVYDPEECWKTMTATIREAVAGLPGPCSIAGLAISSMAEAGVPLDRNGRELYPIITWYDDRTTPQRDWWREHLGAERIFAICGVHLDVIYTLPKIMWIRENEPDVYRRMVRWLCMSDYMSYRLTGEQAMSPSIACRTMAFDVGKRAWSETILEMADLQPELFPPVRESGSVVGHVTPQAAEETGLPVGIPVAVGGHDHMCGAFAVQVYEPGPVLNSVGTTEVILMSTKDFNPRGKNPEKAGFSWGCHVVPGAYDVFGGTRSAGTLTEWLRAVLGKELSDWGDNVYQAMSDAGLSSPRGAKGLFVLPFVSGGQPHRDLEARGVFFGLQSTHTVADIIRAAFEGLSYELRWSIGVLEAFSGIPIDRLRAVGGGTKNELWLRVKADVTGRPIDLPARTEGAALGAALLAGLGAGVYRNPAEAMARVYRVERIVEPDPAAHEIYSQWYEQIYLQLYPRLREPFLATARLFPEE